MDTRQKVTSIAVGSAVFISALFGFEGVELKAYKDPGNGTVTIGAGHTGPEVKLGQKITRKQAEQLAIKDVEKHWTGIRKYIKVPLYQYEAEAYTDLAYNIGVYNFSQSTLLKKLNRGDYAGACKAIKVWVYAGGKKLPGIVKRRDADYKRCIGHEWPKGSRQAAYFKQ